MAHVIRGTRPHIARDDVDYDETVVDERPVTTVRDAYAPNIVARVISFIGGLIMSLLALRFLLSLLGANRGNAFANFIYDVTRPFVEPFFGLFNYTPSFGVARFEFETLVAIVIYGLITWALVRLATMADRRV